MSRHAVTEKTRAEILAELEDYRNGADHSGNQAKAQLYSDAIAAVEQGASEIRVRHMVYRVVEVPPAPMPMIESGVRCAPMPMVEGDPRAI